MPSRCSAPPKTSNFAPLFCIPPRRLAHVEAFLYLLEEGFQLGPAHMAKKQAIELYQQPKKQNLLRCYLLSAGKS